MHVDMYIVVPSPDLPVAPWLPVAPMLPVAPTSPPAPWVPVAPWPPVAPCEPAGPGTATGVAGTLTTVGFSQAARLSVASSAAIGIDRFMATPLEVDRRDTERCGMSAKNPASPGWSYKAACPPESRPVQRASASGANRRPAT